MPTVSVIYIFVGMAVREEFDYISFRCCYCYHFNPARKKRPVAPKLNFEANKTPIISKFSSSDTDKSSYSDSDTDSETGKVREVLDSPDPSKVSDTEKMSDFDKLSDAEMKNFDTEISPLEGSGADKDDAIKSINNVAENNQEAQEEEQDL